MPLRPGFEWFVAWRHLQDPTRRSRRMLVLGLLVCLVGFGLFAFHWWGEPALVAAQAEWAEPLVASGMAKGAAVSVSILGALLTFLGLLLSRFTVFTAISIFGVFLGTSAPIVALSVMSGFEMDLKAKIRGTKADVVVTRVGQTPFTEWEGVRDRLLGIDGVQAATPYIESEVMIRSPANPAGIVLKGIDPRGSSEVLDIGRTLRAGTLDLLENPIKIPLGPDVGGFDGLFNNPDDEDFAGEEGQEREGSEQGAEAAGADTAVAPATGARPGARGNTHGDAVLPGILLGEELYNRILRVFVGSKVDVACPQCGVGPTGPTPKLRSFRVAGHFYTGMYEFDSKLAYISLEEAQRFLGMPGEVTGVEIRAQSPEVARQVAAQAAAALGDGYDVRSWEEMNRGLFTALRLEKIAMFVVLTFIALVASFSIISNLVMLVTEKGREVAILKSMGAPDGSILRIFLAEGIYIGLLGLSVGIATGVGACLLIGRYGLPLNPELYYIQQLPVVMRVDEIAAVGFCALALCCLAALYPALLAARLRPVDGLRYE